MAAEDDNKLLRARLEVATHALKQIAEIHRYVQPDVFVFPYQIESLARRGLEASHSAQRALDQMDKIQLVGPSGSRG